MCIIICVIYDYCCGYQIIDLTELSKSRLSMALLCAGCSYFMKQAQSRYKKVASLDYLCYFVGFVLHITP